MSDSLPVLEDILAVYAALVTSAAENYRLSDAELDLDLLEYYRGKAFGLAEAADLVCGLMRRRWGYSASDASTAAFAEQRMRAPMHQLVNDPATPSKEPWL